MDMEYQILIAFALDLLFGDPRWFPHPVKLIGRISVALETPVRRLIPWSRIAGLILILLVITATGAATCGLLRLAAIVHPLAGSVVSILILYTTFAAHDLICHSTLVGHALRAGNVPQAREAVGMIVGRDTAELDEDGICRAAVETVAENLVDGVTAPILFACIGGPVGAMIYKGINTLDSTFGYRNERFLHFGWASARLDDVANFVPSRLSAPLVALGALLVRQRAADSLRVMWRDCRNHSSPNAGFAEAAVAGALGVQLGGTNIYSGSPVVKPTIGDPHIPLSHKHIRETNILMLTTACLFLLLGLGVRVLFVHFVTS